MTVMDNHSLAILAPLSWIVPIPLERHKIGMLERHR